MACPNIRAVVRVRPPNARETEMGGRTIVQMNRTQTIANVSGEMGGEEKTFDFHRSFWSCSGFEELAVARGDLEPVGYLAKASMDANPVYSDQLDVYESLGFVDAALSGVSCCLISYGQTGAGKSFTLVGNANNPGCLPRLCADVFRRKALLTATDLHVSLSVMEIYNEQLRDLLTPVSDKSRLRIRGRGDSQHIPDLTIRSVDSAEQLNFLLEHGLRARAIAATKMNSQPSRSHVCILVTLEQTSAEGRVRRLSVCF
jgi:hypothetical protein